LEEQRPHPTGHIKQTNSINIISTISIITIINNGSSSNSIKMCSAYSNQNQNQIKIYIAPYVHEDSEALDGWIMCSRRVGIDEFLNVF